MQKKFLFLILFLILSNEIVLGKNGNDTKVLKKINKNIRKIGGKVKERSKRSPGEIDKAFTSHIRHELGNRNQGGFEKYLSEENDLNVDDASFIQELPFWGTRGRRDSSESDEYVRSNDVGYKGNSCKTCAKHIQDMQLNEKYEIAPFWSNRGRRDSDEIGEYNPFWGNRGRRQEEPPFWGNRGRRSKVKLKSQDIIVDPPFWSSRGRRDDVEPFWGNRGRREETEPFWGNRGRHDEDEPFWGNRGRREEKEPFWGNRGRRQENEPFWGTRGRRETDTSFWGNHGKKHEYGYWKAEDTNPFWGNRGRKKFALKESIINAMNNIAYNIENLARMRRGEQDSFWNQRGRVSQLENYFIDPTRNVGSNRPISETKPYSTKFTNKPTAHNTVSDDRIYAEEPHYILIERNTRSSAEDDPFFISRGKKYTNFKLPKGFRDRRGAIEDLVKSVRNDPYYIARGKKDSEYVKIGNSTILKDEFVKAKELICSAIDLLVIKNDGHKVKRDVDESERQRRTTLKKLAAQLQIDPYFVSRGKKNGDTDITEERLEEFVNNVADMCN